MAEVVWTDRASAWLQDIHDYIAQDRPAAAMHVVEAIRNKAMLLEEFPELGYRYERWPERPNLRSARPAQLGLGLVVFRRPQSL